MDSESGMSARRYTWPCVSKAAFHAEIRHPELEIRCFFIAYLQEKTTTRQKNSAIIGLCKKNVLILRLEFNNQR